MLEMLNVFPGFFILYKEQIYPHNRRVTQGTRGWPHKIMLPCPMGSTLPDIAL
jgi:hypothetical protein